MNGLCSNCCTDVSFENTTRTRQRRPDGKYKLMSSSSNLLYSNYVEKTFVEDCASALPLLNSSLGYPVVKSPRYILLHFHQKGAL